MAYAAAAAGLVLGAGGAFLSGKAGDNRLKKLKAIANTPGLDTGAITEEALKDQLKLMGLSEELATEVARINQANVNAAEESALPGVREARQEALGAARSMFGEDSEWLKGVMRRGAALGLSSGLGAGSGAGKMQTLRLSDRESMARKQMGVGMLGSLIGGLRLANTPGVQAFMGPSPSELINIRGQERTQRMNILLQRAGIGGQTQAWANYLNQTGGMLTGAGMMGISGGGMGGGSGGGMPGASQQSLMMQDYMGTSNMGGGYIG